MKAFQFASDDEMDSFAVGTVSLCSSAAVFAEESDSLAQERRVCSAVNLTMRCSSVIIFSPMEFALVKQLLRQKRIVASIKILNFSKTHIYSR